MRNGVEPYKNFLDAIKAENERVSRNWDPTWHYTRVGFYYRQLKQYLKYFKENQLLILLYEDFKNNPYEVLKRVFKFLEVDSEFKPDISSQYQKTGVFKNKFIKMCYKNLKTPKNLRRFGRDIPLLPDFVRKNMSNLIFKKVFPYLVTKIEKKYLMKPPLTVEVREYLPRVFKEDILNFQNLIDTDLSLWLQ